MNCWSEGDSWSPKNPELRDNKQEASEGGSPESKQRQMELDGQRMTRSLLRELKRILQELIKLW